jgi:hypothetical protein
MTEQTKTRFPAPLYAAAGAGDLAYQQLRKLPAVVSELSDRAAASLRTANEQAGTTAATLREQAGTTAATLREQAGTKAATLRDKAGTTDFDALRNNAASAATAFAQVAQERALAVYSALVARGERVVGTGVVEAADVVNADIEATQTPKAVEAAKAVEATAAPAAKPRKRAAKPAGE